MKLEELDKQVKELQKVDFNQYTPEQLNELVDKLLSFVEEGETLLETIKIEDNEEPDIV
jgi:type III secretion system FlhB-like substrate exporter